MHHLSGGVKNESDVLGRDHKILAIGADHGVDRFLYIGIDAGNLIRGEKMAEDEIGWVESIRFWSFPLIVIFVIAFVVILMLRL